MAALNAPTGHPIDVAKCVVYVSNSSKTIRRRPEGTWSVMRPAQDATGDRSLRKLNESTAEVIEHVALVTAAMLNAQEIEAGKLKHLQVVRAGVVAAGAVAGLRGEWVNRRQSFYLDPGLILVYHMACLRTGALLDASILQQGHPYPDQNQNSPFGAGIDTRPIGAGPFWGSRSLFYPITPIYFGQHGRLLHHYVTFEHDGRTLLDPLPYNASSYYDKAPWEALYLLATLEDSDPLKHKAGVYLDASMRVYGVLNDMINTLVEFSPDERLAHIDYSKILAAIRSIALRLKPTSYAAQMILRQLRTDERLRTVIVGDPTSPK